MNDITNSSAHDLNDSAPPSSGADDLLPEGSRFGGYLVGPCIGEGGMARIYRAEHEGLQRQVALKVLLEGLGKVSDAHERFVREARLAAAIKHPNVVNIFDVGVHAGAPYLVMELLEGVDLDSFVQAEGPLEEPTILDVIVPIVAGLAAVHDAGIVHRDLKPGNIFLAHGRADELEPKLLDFGISKAMSSDTMKLTSGSGLLMGTPFYMSPEASRGEEMTALSDQYALGVVLYECATGVNPFAAANSFGDVIRRVTTGDYPPVSHHNPRLSKRMAGIIARAMHLNPAQRFSDMRAMGRELLLLAGQRTNVTWGLSFSEWAPATAAMEKRRGPALALPRALRTFRKRYAAAGALLVGLASMAGAQALRARQSVAERAPIERNDSLAALRPAELPRHAPAAPAPSNTLTPAPEQAVQSAPERTSPPHTESKPTGNDERPQRVATNGPRPPAPEAEDEKPSVGGPLEGDWLTSAQPSAQQGVTTAHGTNNAPIFD